MLVGYMRVSSEGDRQTTALQRDALLAAGVDDRHLYEDKASGARADRPGLVRALEFARTGDCMVVWKLDRLGRSLPHLLSIVTGLRERGVAFRSLTEQMDTTTPHGELLFSIFGALAQYERALTQERVRAGLADAKRRGRRGGRPPEINAEKLDAIIAALNSGATKAAVCRTFGAKRTTLIETLARAKLLVLDDWGPEPLTAEQARDLLEIVEDRYDAGSVLITSQVPVDRWYEMISIPTLADAVLDRLIHNAYRIELSGDSLRKQRPADQAA